MVVKSWFLTLVTAQTGMPSSAEDYHMGFEASLVVRDQGAIHINIGAFLAEVPLRVFFAAGLVNLPQWGCQPPLVHEISRW